jgi:hypothetical protein
MLGAAATTASGILAAPALAQSTNAAEKMPMTRIGGLGVACSGNNSGGTPTASFANIKRDANNTVSAEVNLTRVTPNKSFLVIITATPNNGPCGPSESVQTNRNGQATAHISAPLSNGKTGVFVAAIGGNTQLVTANYVFGSK